MKKLINLNKLTGAEYLEAYAANCAMVAECATCEDVVELLWTGTKETLAHMYPLINVRQAKENCVGVAVYNEMSNREQEAKEAAAEAGKAALESGSSFEEKLNELAEISENSTTLCAKKYIRNAFYASETIEIARLLGFEMPDGSTEEDILEDMLDELTLDCKTGAELAEKIRKIIYKVAVEVEEDEIAPVDESSENVAELESVPSSIAEMTALDRKAPVKIASYKKADELRRAHIGQDDVIMNTHIKRLAAAIRIIDEAVKDGYTCAQMPMTEGYIAKCLNGNELDEVRRLFDIRTYGLEYVENGFDSDEEYIAHLISCKIDPIAEIYLNENSRESELESEIVSEAEVEVEEATAPETASESVEINKDKFEYVKRFFMTHGKASAVDFILNNFRLPVIKRISEVMGFVSDSEKEIEGFMRYELSDKEFLAKVNEILNMPESEDENFDAILYQVRCILVDKQDKQEFLRYVYDLKEAEALRLAEYFGFTIERTHGITPTVRELCKTIDEAMSEEELCELALKIIPIDPESLKTGIRAIHEQISSLLNAMRVCDRNCKEYSGLPALLKTIWKHYQDLIRKNARRV